MNPPYPDQWPQFFTATINDWKPLLKPDKYKNIITDSLKFLVHDKRIILNGFVIMRNHIHLIWQACHGHTLQKAQESLMKYAAQQIKFDLLKNKLPLLDQYKINATDRNYFF